MHSIRVSSFAILAVLAQFPSWLEATVQTLLSTANQRTLKGQAVSVLRRTMFSQNKICLCIEVEHVPNEGHSATVSGCPGQPGLHQNYTKNTNERHSKATFSEPKNNIQIWSEFINGLIRNRNHNRLTILLTVCRQFFGLFLVSLRERLSMNVNDELFKQPINKSIPVSDPK